MKKILFIIGMLTSFVLYGQIDTIQNGDSGLSARNKLNRVIDTLNNHTATKDELSDSIQYLQSQIDTLVTHSELDSTFQSAKDYADALSITLPTNTPRDSTLIYNILNDLDSIVCIDVNCDSALVYAGGNTTGIKIGGSVSTVGLSEAQVASLVGDSIRLLMDNIDSIRLSTTGDSTLFYSDGDTMMIGLLDPSAGISETDPIYSASVASSIIEDDTNTWNILKYDPVIIDKKLKVFNNIELIYTSSNAANIRGAWTDGDLYFGALYESGIRSFTLDTGKLTTVNTIDNGGQYLDVFSNGDGFVFAAINTLGVGSYSYDGSGTLSLVEVQSHGLNNYSGIWSDGTYIYAACRNEGLKSYSYDGSGDVTFIDSDDQGGVYYEVIGDGTLIYVFSSIGLLTYSVDGGGNLTHIDTEFHNESTTNKGGIFIYDSLVFMSGGITAGDVNMYSVNEYGIINYIDSIPAYLGASEIYADGNYIYIATLNSLSIYSYDATGFNDIIFESDSYENTYSINNISDTLYLSSSSGPVVSINKLGGTAYFKEDIIEFYKPIKLIDKPQSGTFNLTLKDGLIDTSEISGSTSYTLPSNVPLDSVQIYEYIDTLPRFTDLDTTFQSAKDYTDAVAGNGNIVSSIEQDLSTQTEDGILFTRGDSIFTDSKFKYLPGHGGRLQYYTDNTTEAFAENVYSYLNHTGLEPYNVISVLYENQVSTALRSNTALYNKITTFNFTSVPSDVYTYQAAHYAITDNNSTNSCTFSNPSGVARLAGSLSYLEGIYNDNTSGTGTYLLGAVIGRANTTGTAKSYGVISEGDSYTQGTHYVSNNIVVDDSANVTVLIIGNDTISNITNYVDSTDLEINGSQRRIYAPGHYYGGGGGSSDIDTLFQSSYPSTGTYGVKFKDGVFDTVAFDSVLVFTDTIYDVIYYTDSMAIVTNNFDTMMLYKKGHDYGGGGGSSFDPTYLHYRIDSLAALVTTLRDSVAIVQVLEDSITNYQLKFNYLYAQIYALWVALDTIPPVIDTDAPVFVSAEIGSYDDSIFVILMDTTDLQQDSIINTAFYITENGNEYGSDTAYIHNDTIFIAMDSIGLYAATYLIDYTQIYPYLQDSSGNLVVNWVDSTVTNNISAPPAEGGDTTYITWNSQTDILWDEGGGYWYSTGLAFEAMGVADQYIAAADSGWYSYYAQTVSDGSGVLIALGMDATTANTGYTTYDYGTYIGFGTPYNIYYLIDGSDLSTAIGTSNGSYIRLRKSAAGNLYIEYSTDETTWNQAYSFGAVSGDLYLKLNIYDEDSRVYDLKGFNVTEQ